MTKIYVVIGSSGEYSDRTEWLEGAYTSEDAAKSRVLELDELLREWDATAADSWEWGKRQAFESKFKALPRGDSKFQLDYTGTRYCYEPVEVKG